MPGFKIKDGDICGKNGVVLFKRLHKDDKGKWIGEFICPVCGKHFCCRIDNVSRGDRKSCGCLAEEAAKKLGQNNFKNLTGQIFGELTVIKQLPERNSDRRVQWLCKCSCGNETIVDSHCLLNGHTKSCGHIHAKICRNLFVKDLTGQVFGELKVIKDTGKSYKTKGQSHAIWLCECQNDGNLIEVRSDSLINGHVISCGCCQESYYADKIKSILKELNTTFITEKTFDGCINPNTGYKLRFDFYLPKLNICIEYDGEQHFREVPFYTESLQDRQYKDRIKDSYCAKNCINLIRISYLDKDKINTQYISNLIFGEE